MQQDLNVPEALSALELQVLEGCLSSEGQAQLLACYLIVNDLLQAQLVWKRTPPASKDANSELKAVWEIGRHLWLRELPAAYAAARKTDWSDALKPFIAKLVTSIGERAVCLVEKAYSSIKAQTFASLTGLTPEEAVNLAKRRGWTVEPGSQMLHPKASAEQRRSEPVSADQQLPELTDIVTFLEN